MFSSSFIIIEGFSKFQFQVRSWQVQAYCISFIVPILVVEPLCDIWVGGG
jgi:hypothetical protein